MMNVFLVDLTHGGVKISSELAKSKNYDKVFAYDLYNTLKKEDESLLNAYGIEIMKDLDSFKKALEDNSNKKVKQGKMEKDLIINPIHSSLNIRELLSPEHLNQYEIINHHQATALALSDWKEETKKQNVKTIEITGVKGKTSTAFLLKEIFLENNKNTLLLSSLGAYLFRKNEGNEQDLILQKNISITPANIISTIQLAKKIANPKCSTFPISDAQDEITEKNITFPKSDAQEDIDKKMDRQEEIAEASINPYNDLNYDVSIFENSLGICGLADIGILTNLVENYSIAKGSSNAREAKKQVFNAPLIVMEHETLNESYPHESEKYKDKINTFSLKNSNANVYCEEIDYDIDNTHVKIVYKNLRTLDKKMIKGKIDMDCFAPGPHHVLNILSAATCALAFGIDKETIQNALLNFKGIDGRTNVRKIGNDKEEISQLRIIEEINPGINTKAIESSIKMIKDIANYYIIIGGKYGVTCEEIDEDKLSRFLCEYLNENLNSNLILTDEVGKSLKEKMELILNKEYQNPIKIEFIEDYKDAQDIAIENNKNILFIYRSNYSQVSKR